MPIDSCYFNLEERPVAGLEPHPLSAEIFGQLSDVQFVDLQRDIEQFGLLHPLELDKHGRVICGSQRLRVIKELGWQSVHCLVREDLEDEEAIRHWLIRDNIMRRQLTPGQLYRAGVELERILAVQAERRAHANLNQGCTSPVAADAALGEVGRTDDQVARELHTSGDTYRRVKKVFESDDEDLKQMVDQGLMSISAGAAKVRERQVQAKPIEQDDHRLMPLRLAKWITVVEKFFDWLEKHPPQFEHLNPKTREVLGKVRDMAQRYLDEIA